MRTPNPPDETRRQSFVHAIRAQYQVTWNRKIYRARRSKAPTAAPRRQDLAVRVDADTVGSRLLGRDVHQRGVGHEVPSAERLHLAPGDPTDLLGEDASVRVEGIDEELDLADGLGGGVIEVALHDRMPLPLCRFPVQLEPALPARLVRFDDLLAPAGSGDEGTQGEGHPNQRGTTGD